VHPIKSCAGFEVPEGALIETGLEFDREWMVVDAHGDMLTQREHPRMALIETRLRRSDLMLRAPGMLALHLSLDTVEAPTRVRVWDDLVKAYEMGALAAQWFSDFLRVPGLRLVRFDPEQQRLAERRWTGDLEARTAFADGFPLLVMSTASLGELNRRLQAAGQPPVAVQRFRPNLVLDGLDDPHAEDAIGELEIDAPEGAVRLKLVKPCVRCGIPDVDPGTAATGHTVSDALRTYRADPRMGGGLTFGMNAVIVEGIGHTVRAGATVRAAFGF
jgi:hypothetical protein